MNRWTKWITITAAALPLLSLAQPVVPVVGGQATFVRRFEDILRIMDVFIGWFQAILFVLAVIFILVAAFFFITAAGDKEKVGTARTMIVWAAVGIGVALLAFAVRPIVQQLLGG